MSSRDLKKGVGRGFRARALTEAIREKLGEEA